MRRAFLVAVYRATRHCSPLHMVAAGDIAEMLDLSHDEAEEVLESLYQRGLVFRMGRSAALEDLQVLITQKGITSIDKEVDGQLPTM